MSPASVRPAEQDKSLGLELFLDLGAELLDGAVQLAVVGIGQRDLQRQHAAVNVGEPIGAQQSHVESPEPHLADDVGVVSGHAARVKAELHLAAGRLLPRRAHFLKDLVPFGALGSDRRHLDDHLVGRP